MKQSLLILWISLFLAMGCDTETITKDGTGTGGEDLPQEDSHSTEEGGSDALSPEVDSEEAAQDSTLPDAQEESLDGVTASGSGAPEGYATLTFSVDDSANKTYSDGQMRWTGSFVWDEESNTLNYASSWLPEDGPYPALYDDGPRSEGGREMEGAVAGDALFTTEVYVLAEEDVAFEYGLLNELDNWIWVGANGLVELEAGSTDILALPSMVIPAFGDVDGRLTLDTLQLHEDFAEAPIAKVFVKGTLNSWASVQILDNGKGADEVADDGIYTYQHKTSLGPHDGGLSPGSEVQFVFMLGLNPEGFADDALEYKATGDALMDGVMASTDAEESGVWQSVPVILSQDSKGKTMNTAFVVPGDSDGPPDCTSSRDCEENEVCSDAGKCEPASQEECEDDEDCLPGELCAGGTCAPIETGPPECVNEGDCPDGKVCKEGVCEDLPEPLSTPAIYVLTPTSGSKAGGTSVTLLGDGFVEGLSIRFDGIEGTSVAWISAQEVTCLTPAHSPGAVSATLINPDSGETSFPNAFTYLDEEAPPTEPTVKGPSPSGSPLEGGTSIQVDGWLLDEVVAVRLDNQDVSFEWVGNKPVFVAPPGVLGEERALSVELSDGTELESPVPLRYGLVGTPTLDGQKSPNEWPETYRIASNSLPSTWGEGKNELSAAYASFDETHLYLGFAGRVESAQGDASLPNSIQIFIDRDPGAGTGVKECVDLEDNAGSGDLDDALSGLLSFQIEGFGADLAAGTIGMTSMIEGSELSSTAGWRLFDDWADFTWLQGTVVAGEDGWIEMGLSLSQLFEAGVVPQGGGTIHAIALVGNNYGNAFSNQSLPEMSDPGAPEVKTNAMTLEILDL